MREHCAYHPASGGAAGRENDTGLPWPKALPIVLMHTRLRRRTATRTYCSSLSATLADINRQAAAILPVPGPQLHSKATDRETSSWPRTSDARVGEPTNGRARSRSCWSLKLPSRLTKKPPGLMPAIVRRVVTGELMVPRSKGGGACLQVTAAGSVYCSYQSLYVVSLMVIKLLQRLCGGVGGAHSGSVHMPSNRVHESIIQ